MVLCVKKLGRINRFNSMDIHSCARVDSCRYLPCDGAGGVSLISSVTSAQNEISSVVTLNFVKMFESGVDLGFDFAELSSEDLNLECGDLLNQEESLAVSSSQNDFMFYELKSKTVPERLVSFQYFMQ